MQDTKIKKEKYLARKRRVRSKIFGSKDMPRLSVFRSNKYMYAQIIDDEKGVTLLAVKGTDPTGVGEAVAKKALAKKIKKIVFDRGGFAYHGRVKALAEGARKGGLKF